MRAIGTKAQRLLEAARTGDEPSAAQITALGERLLSELAANASTGLGAAQVTATRAKGLTLAAKWIASGVLGTVGVASVALFVGFGPEQPSAPAPKPSTDARASISSVPALPVAPPAEAAEPEPARSEVTPGRRRAAPVAEPALRLQEESALLAASQRALSRGELALALAHLDRYDQRFPSGVLRTEAATARVLALCSGAAPKARALKAAERFLARYPQSPARARIVRVCGL